MSNPRIDQVFKFLVEKDVTVSSQPREIKIAHDPMTPIPHDDEDAAALLRPQTGLQDVFSSSMFPIVNNIASFLEIHDLINLSRTCQQFYHTFNAVKRSQWNINRFLSRFVTDPKAFRGAMARSDAIISGSAALQFIGRWNWEESDLDIYVERKGDWEVDKEAPVEILAKFLIADGYWFSPTPGQLQQLQEAAALPSEKEYWDYVVMSTWDELIPVAEMMKTKMIEEEAPQKIDDYGRLVAHVYTFRRPEHGLRPARKIQIMASGPTPLQQILEFHSTVVLNIITWNKAYSLFPLATFARRTNLVITTISDSILPCLKKYESRGWETRYLVAEREDEIPPYPVNPFPASRFVGDRYTWAINLDTAGVTAPETVKPNFVIEISGFTLRWLRHDSWARGYPQPEWTSTQPTPALYNMLTTEVISSPALKYRYLSGCLEWVAYLMPRLEVITDMELIRARPKDADVRWDLYVFSSEHQGWNLHQLEPGRVSRFYDGVVPGFFAKHLTKLRSTYYQQFDALRLQLGGPVPKYMGKEGTGKKEVCECRAAGMKRPWREFY